MYHHKKYEKKNEKFYRINERIRISPIILISQEGEKLGVIPVDAALQKARDAGLDLVEIAADVRPPVCRIMDFNKFRYEQSLKEKEQRKKQRLAATQLKEVHFRPNIAEHDLMIKIGAARRFLDDGDKVRIQVKFSGKRELAHRELGFKVLERVIKELEEVGACSKKPVFDGKAMFCIMDSKKKGDLNG